MVGCACTRIGICFAAIRASSKSSPRSRRRRRTVPRRGERQPVLEAKAEAIFAMSVAQAVSVWRMTKTQIEHTGGIRGPRRFRYLIDIVVLVAVTFLLDLVLGAFIPAPIDWRKGFVFDAIGKMLLVGVAWGLVRLRGERLADIGLKRPASWMRTFVIGIGLAAIVFIAMYVSEKAGFRRDLSKFKDVQGNFELMLFGVFYA